MRISRFVVNPIEENTYILWDEEKREAAIVDPGMMRANERNVVDEFVSKNNLSVKMVLMTHLHFDHAASARYIADKYGVKVYGSLDDAHLGEVLPTQSRMFGMEIDIKPLFIDEALQMKRSKCLPYQAIRLVVWLFICLRVAWCLSVTHCLTKV